jgi:hypothetical protein
LCCSFINHSWLLNMPFSCQKKLPEHSWISRLLVLYDYDVLMH